MNVFQLNVHPAYDRDLEFADELFSSKRKAAVRANYLLKEYFNLQVSVRDLMRAEDIRLGARFGDSAIVVIQEREIK